MKNFLIKFLGGYTANEVVEAEDKAADKFFRRILPEYRVVSSSDRSHETGLPYYYISWRMIPHDLKVIGLYNKEEVATYIVKNFHNVIAPAILKNTLEAINKMDFEK